MKEDRNRERQMLDATRKIVKDYLFDGICDYESIAIATAEMLWEDFAVKNPVATNLAKKLIDQIWDDVVTEVEAEIQEARDYYRSREMDLADAREGRW